jgi:hypothetical protein
VQSAVYDIIVPVAAAQGSFISGIDNGVVSIVDSKSDELYLVVGKSPITPSVNVDAKDAGIDSITEVKDKVKKRHLDGEDLTLVCYNSMTKKVRNVNLNVDGRVNSIMCCIIFKCYLPVTLICNINRIQSM